MNTKNIITLVFVSIWMFLSSVAFGADQANQYVRGIYINEETMWKTNYLKSLIEQSKAVGINTFVIDMLHCSKRYQENIKLVNASGIKYVARIVVFPDGGGTNDQVLSQQYWETIYVLADKAIQLGASEIQLDYIRYKTTQPPSEKNAQNIYNVIKWFKGKLQARGIPLQVDVFGISSFRESVYIGQDLKLFGNTVDAICPMVYPSHYEPYQKYAKRPYFTVKSSLDALRKQFLGVTPFKVYPFIELYNYRYPLSQPEKLEYISEQLRAVTDSNTAGWYAWNIHNDYYNLFLVLENQKRSVSAAH